MQRCLPLLALAGFVSFGCASLELGVSESKPAASMEWADVEARLSGRAEPGAAEEAFDAALEERPLDSIIGPSALSIPSPEERSLPSQSGFWMVRALAWAPQVRAARRAVSALQGEARSAGAPAPVFVQAVDHQLGGEDELVEAIGVLDLVGLLGLGPSAAQGRLATARVEEGLVALEVEAFRACLSVERARVRAVASRARRDRFGDLLKVARQDLERVRILRERGRLSDSDAELALAEVARIERAASLAEVALWGAQRDLALASGTPVETGAREILEVGASGLAEIEPLAPVADSSPSDAHPRLRASAAAFRVAEKSVREAASRAWPGLGLGPHLGFLDGARVGAVLRLALPFPSSWKGRLEAAVQRRDRAVEAYDETLLELQQSALEARGRLAELERRRDPVSGATWRAAAPAESHWKASRALFRTGRGPLSAWTKALNHLTETVTWEVDDAEAIALAELDLVEAVGFRAPAKEVGSSEARP
ncbi:MAG: hypothetical protein AAGG01_07540 [Planctomycetota bacterium]